MSADSVVNNKRLTDEAYWNSTWTRRRLLEPRRWRGHPAVRAMAAVIGREIGRLEPGRRSRPRLLEVGCADSYWLPFAAQEWNAEITGVDFSPMGCEQAEEQLARQGQRGTVVCADFFEFATQAQEFDIILSFGFVEHFRPPRRAFEPMMRQLAPGGRLFAAVPNLKGIYGPLQWLLSPEVYHAHVRCSAADLRIEATAAGLADAIGGYCGGPLHFGVLNFTKGRTPWLSRAMRHAGRAVSIIDRAVARAGDSLGGRLDSAWFSPHAYVVGGRALAP